MRRDVLVFRGAALNALTFSTATRRRKREATVRKRDGHCVLTTALNIILPTFPCDTFGSRPLVSGNQMNGDATATHVAHTEHRHLCNERTRRTDSLQNHFNAFSKTGHCVRLELAKRSLEVGTCPIVVTTKTTASVRVTETAYEPPPRHQGQAAKEEPVPEPVRRFHGMVDGGLCPTTSASESKGPQLARVLRREPRYALPQHTGNGLSPDNVPRLPRFIRTYSKFRPRSQNTRAEVTIGAIHRGRQSEISPRGNI